MIISFTRSLKEYFRTGNHKEFLLLSGVLVLLSVFFFGSVVTAHDGAPANALGYYTDDSGIHWILPEDNLIVTDMKGLSPSAVEARYPMSTESEAGIIQPELKIPVIIDGIRYEGNQISQFNGKRLYFVIGTDGTLYAFTSAKGLEQFQTRHFAQPSPLYPGIDSLFFFER
jgi:hypothetical protein